MNATEKRSIKLLVKIWNIGTWTCVINFLLCILISVIEQFNHPIFAIFGLLFAMSAGIMDLMRYRNLYKLKLYKEKIKEYRLRKNVIKVFELIENKEFDEASKYYSKFINDRIAMSFLTPYIVGILTKDEDKRDIVKIYTDRMKNIYDPNKIFK
jgi:hypothetical protein